MIQIVNSVAACMDSGHRLRPCGNKTEGEVIHRWSIKGADAASIAMAERGMDELGNKMTYNIAIHPDGTIEQALPLDVFGWHARSHSRTMTGIVCVGDFRGEEMPYPQYRSLVEVVGWLSIRRGSIKVRGHDQLPGGSSDPSKQCPGRMLDIGDLHYAIKKWCQFHAEQSLKTAGLVLEAAYTGV